MVNELKQTTDAVSINEVGLIQNLTDTIGQYFYGESSISNNIHCANTLTQHQTKTMHKIDC